MPRTHRTAFLLLLAALVAAPAAAQDVRGRRDRSYSWSERMSSGSTLRIFDFSGSISVLPSDDGTAEVRAEKHVRGNSDIEDISFDVRRRGADVTFCTLWRDDTDCDEDGIRMHGRGSHDASVTLTVRLPRGVRLHAGSGNGEISVDDAGSDVEVSSGNGRVRVTTARGSVRASTGNGALEVTDASGPVRASTGNGSVRVTTSTGPVTASSGNGSIEVRMSSLRAADDMDFHTGNGSVRIYIPGSFNGELDASTGRGELHSDFPLTVRGRFTPNHVRATIGSGGPRIHLTSGNGDIELLKSAER